MRPPHVVALLLDGLVTFDLACASQVFGRALDGVPVPLYRFGVCAARPGSVATSDGFAIAVERGLDALAAADTVVVPGYVPCDVRPPDAALAALRAAHARGARILSICTGAFALAHAGLLAHRRATTHWSVCAALAERFPAVRVEPDVLYVGDGDVMTSAGVAAGLDLCLHVVRDDYGAQVAAEVARWNVAGAHRGADHPQLVQTPLPADSADPVATAREWALGHLHEPLDIATLAARAYCSPRTFSRRFKAQTGATPKQWLLAARVQLAQRLLETTDLDVETVAQHAGFHTPAALRVHFQRVTGTAPTGYRAAFRPRSTAARPLTMPACPTPPRPTLAIELDGRPRRRAVVAARAEHA